MLTFHGPPERVQCLTFVPGPGGPAVAAGYRGAVHVWPLAGGEPAVLAAGTPEDLRGTTGLLALAAPPDGDWLAGRRYGGNSLWRRRGGRWADAGRLVGNPPPWATFQGPDLVYTLGRWDEPEGRWVYEVIRGRPSDAGPPVQSHAAVRTRPPPKDTYKGRGHACANLAELAPDGRTLATSAGEKAVQLWDATTGEHQGTLRQRGFVMALAWGPDGRTLVVNAGVTVRLYDAPTRAERLTWPVKYCYIPQLAFSPDGRLVATTDNGTAVHLWDAATGARRASLRAGRVRRAAVAFAPDGLTLAAGGADGSVVVWDIA